MEFDYEKRERQQRKYEEIFDCIVMMGLFVLIFWIICHFFGK
jgi:hypothetical protein